MSAALVHIGITVTDIEKVSEFYIRYFGFEKDYGAFFDDEYFEAQSALFKQPAGVHADMQMIRSPNGVMLELFRFSEEALIRETLSREMCFPDAEKGGAAEWRRTGYNHIALRVDDLPAVCDRLKEDGIEFFMSPQIRSRGDGHWIYLRDPDGNLVELWD